jgi:hypothetical protein
MQRRKFLVGVGSFAAAGAAAMGTGALSVDARRKADFRVATDENALLGLTPGDTALVYEETDDNARDQDGTLAFDFSEVQAEGFNKQAVTRIEEAFYITNNSGQKMEVSVFTGNSPRGETAVKNDFISFHAGSSDAEILNHRGQSDTTSNNVVLDSGEKVAVDIVVDTEVGYKGTEAPDALFGANNPPYNLEINAASVS